jgi:hypothetical protein
MGDSHIGCGFVTVLYPVVAFERESDAFSIPNNKNMKKKEEKSCRNVALLFLHESNRFFLNKAVNCWYSNGNPCISSMFFFSSLLFNFLK